jgi:ankyrin repeat protein
MTDALSEFGRYLIASCDKDDITELFKLACQSKREVLAESLIKTDIDISKIEDIFFSVYQWSYIASKIIHKGIDINRVNFEGRTALMFVSEFGDIDILTELIESGADLNIQDMYGYTALMYSCNRGQCDLNEMLIKSGANVNLLNDEKDSVLLMTCRDGQNSTATLLIESGADVNLNCENGYTPLMCACENRLEDVVSKMIEYGVNLDSKNDTGEDGYLYLDIWDMKGLYGKALIFGHQVKFPHLSAQDKKLYKKLREIYEKQIHSNLTDLLYDDIAYLVSQY